MAPYWFQDMIRTVLPRDARNWLRSPSKSIEWLWDSARFSLGGRESFDSLLGWSLVCHPRAWKIFRRDQIIDPDQSAEFKNFVSSCSRSMLLYDVGAHFGIFSLAAAHFGGRAVAVDPSPTATRMIETQIALNRCSDRVRVLCAAASDTSAGMDMLSSGIFSDGYFKTTKGRIKKELTRVQTVTIDQLARQFGPPSHIKIDVEGHEAAVLRGGADTLCHSSPLLFIELHTNMVASEGADPGAALDVIRGFGYQTFALDGHVIERSGILRQSISRIIARRARYGEGITQTQVARC